MAEPKSAEAIRPSSSNSLSLEEFRSFVDMDPDSIVDERLPRSDKEDLTMPIHVRTSIAITKQDRTIPLGPPMRDTIRQVTNSSESSGEDNCSHWSNESRVPSRGAAALASSETSRQHFASAGLLKKESDRSLSSTNSSGTVIVKRSCGPKKRASYSAFPKSKGSVQTPMLVTSSPLNEVVRSASQRTADRLSPRSFHRSNNLTPSPGTSSSSESPALLAMQRRRIDCLEPEGSWADYSGGSPQPLPRISARTLERWNPRFSVIHSSGSQSTASGDRTSRTLWTSSSSGSKCSFSALDPSIDIEYPPFSSPGSEDQLKRVSPDELPTLNAAQSKLPVIKPPPVTTKSRNVSTSTIRVVPDTASEKEYVSTPTPIIQTFESSIQPSRALLESATASSPLSESKANVRASLFHDGIPAWAKAYYGTPKSPTPVQKAGSMKRTSTSTDNISLRIFRLGSQNPRPRPSISTSLHRKSGLRMHPVRSSSIKIMATRRGSTHPWSPHLWHKRTSLNKRHTVFEPPNVPKQAEGYRSTRRTLQIILFTFGFAFPPLWLLAASLPVTVKDHKVLHYRMSKAKDSFQDPEKQGSMMEEIWCQNARWWRHINRIMCCVGFVVIAAVVGLFFVIAIST